MRFQGISTEQCVVFPFFSTEKEEYGNDTFHKDSYSPFTRISIRLSSVFCCQECLSGGLEFCEKLRSGVF